MDLCSLNIKWKDPEQQTTTDPNVTDLHLTVFISQAPSTGICGFFLSCIPPLH